MTECFKPSTLPSHKDLLIIETNIGKIVSMHLESSFAGNGSMGDVFNLPISLRIVLNSCMVIHSEVYLKVKGAIKQDRTQ